MVLDLKVPFENTLKSDLSINRNIIPGAVLGCVSKASIIKIAIKKKTTCAFLQTNGTDLEMKFALRWVYWKQEPVEPIFGSVGIRLPETIAAKLQLLTSLRKTTKNLGPERVKAKMFNFTPLTIKLCNFYYLGEPERAPH